MITRADIIFNSITMAGTKPVDGIKYMSGPNRKWEFGKNYEYVFVIKPDGTGVYGKNGIPHELFYCQVNE